MSTITKSEIAANVADVIGSSKDTGAKAVNAVIREIGTALQGGDDVRLAGLGTFSVKATKARAGINPATGARIDIPAGKKISFKPSADLKAGL